MKAKNLKTKIIERGGEEGTPRERGNRLVLQRTKWLLSRKEENLEKSSSRRSETAVETAKKRVLPKKL